MKLYNILLNTKEGFNGIIAFIFGYFSQNLYKKNQNTECSLLRYVVLRVCDAHASRARRDLLTGSRYMKYRLADGGVAVGDATRRTIYDPHAQCIELFC